MFCIKVAQVVIGIRHRYRHIKWVSSEYRVRGEKPAFVVKVDREEIARERGDRKFSRGYCESLCIQRRLCTELVDYDAFLLHAAVIAVDGEAYGFAAPSGTGKTTHLTLWEKRFGDRCEVVNGDKPIIRLIDGRFQVCGNPWKGKECKGKNIIRPLKALCFVERAEQNTISRMKLSDVVTRIFHQVLMPKDEHRMIHFMDLLDQLTQQVPCYLLRCNMEPEAAQVAFDGMNDQGGANIC